MTTHERDLLAEQFEQNRAHLRAVAYRMLGSMNEAEDAVQESWFRLERTDEEAIQNLRAWLTTVVGRVCLDMLRTRRSRHEYSPEDWRPEPIVVSGEGNNPAEEVELADSLGLALLVVLETLSPVERLAFVLHDVFGVEFDEIATIVGKSPVAARQLASRARRRVRADARVPEGDVNEQRQVVDAFLAASRSGSFEGLVEILDPDVVFRSDRGPDGRLTPMVFRGKTAVASQILAQGSRLAHLARPAIVNGAAGVVVRTENQIIGIVGFTVAGGRVVAIDLSSDPDRISSYVERMN
ncbi:MAG TPA: RNA polymerase sigma factor SigJ [Chloroflexota bacterium]